MREKSKLSAERPIDPRARRVAGVVHTRANYYQLELECGHIARRRLMCAPASVICEECQP